MDNSEFALVVMSDLNIANMHHIFLLDLITENYKLISTLENSTKEEAQDRANVLASLSLQEIKSEVYKLSNRILKEEEKESD